jgi:hypothetical protein
MIYAPTINVTEYDGGCLIVMRNAILFTLLLVFVYPNTRDDLLTIVSLNYLLLANGQSRTIIVE